MEILSPYPQIAIALVTLLPLATIAVFAVRKASGRVKEILRTELEPESD